MERTLTLSTVLVLAGALCAQPTLTYTSNAPMPGAMYTLHYGPYVSEGSSGADQIWDMGALASDSLDMIHLVDPAITPNGASFPTATVAETGADAVMYFRAAADGMYLAGSDATGVLIPYSDEGRYLPFPVTYTDTWSDDAAAQFTVETIDVTRTAVITGEADGYGTLLMPGWSAPNVLRVHWHEETTDSTMIFTVESVYDSYLYFVEGQSYPIVQLVHTEATILGNTTTSEHAQWVDELSTAVADAHPSTGLEIFPVPAKGILNLRLPSGIGTAYFTVADAQGRVLHQPRVALMRDGIGQVDISTLPAGLYTLTVRDAQGGLATRRFIVE